LPRRQPVAGPNVAAPQKGVHGLEWWKRAIDVVLSPIVLILSSPVMLILAVLIKATSSGPVIYRQERIGLNRRGEDRRRGMGNGVGLDQRNGDRRGRAGFGKPFTMYKFRTMTHEAENGRPEWSASKDPRITPIGRILRKTRLDEVPQFVNVLRGDMSVVGPRPERAYFLAKADRDLPNFKLRLRTKPGITGLAQIEHGYTNTVEGLHKKLVFDLEYIEKLSLQTDLKILLRTVAVVLTGKGAY
jgi:lipopolysaccharide/colanic/teichoic acid biosynthesis glycosyltransferase